jgi:hypothetical protein
MRLPSPGLGSSINGRLNEDITILLRRPHAALAYRRPKTSFALRPTPRLAPAFAPAAVRDLQSSDASLAVAPLSAFILALYVLATPVGGIILEDPEGTWRRPQKNGR